MKTHLADWLRIGGTGLILLLVAGCTSLAPVKREPVTVTQVVEMSKAGTPTQAIIDKIRDSGTVYRLKASEFADLKQRGVADDVLDYMQQTYLHAVREDQRLDDWGLWTRGPDAFWYGGMPYGWPYSPGWYAYPYYGPYYYGPPRRPWYHGTRPPPKPHDHAH